MTKSLLRRRLCNKWYTRPTSIGSNQHNNVVSTSSNSNSTSSASTDSSSSNSNSTSSASTDSSSSNSNSTSSASTDSSSSNSNSTSSASTDSSSSNSNSTEDASGTSTEKSNESVDMFDSYMENSNLNDTDDSSPEILSINEEDSYDDDIESHLKVDLNKRLFEETATTNESLVADSFLITKSICKRSVKKTLAKKTAKRSANDYCCEHIHLFIPEKLENSEDVSTPKRAKKPT